MSQISPMLYHSSATLTYHNEGEFLLKQESMIYLLKRKSIWFMWKNNVVDRVKGNIKI